jgi:hypothetical protein
MRSGPLKPGGERREVLNEADHFRARGTGTVRIVPAGCECRDEARPSAWLYRCGESLRMRGGRHQLPVGLGGRQVESEFSNGRYELTRELQPIAECSGETEG